MKFKLVYQKRKSPKGSYYDVLYADLGYRTCFLCFDRSVIAELLSKSVAELYEVPPDTSIVVGEIDGSLFNV